MFDAPYEYDAKELKKALSNTYMLNRGSVTNWK